MARSKNVKRPYVRSRGKKADLRGDSHGSLTGGPSRLASLAGMSERANVEQLEKRQMLFSLTVAADDVDPATGLGTVHGYFGYYIPFLATTLTITQTDGQSVPEDFNDEPYGPIGSGRLMLQSGVVVQHNVFPAGDIAVTGIPPDNTNSERWMRVSLNQAQEFFQFKFIDPTAQIQQFIAVRTAQFSIAGDGATDNTGILTDQTRVSLIYNNTVTASYQGAALRALITGGNAALGTGVYNFVAPNNAPAFDTIRVELVTAVPAGSSVNPAFRLDNFAYTTPPPTYNGILDIRGQFGALAVLTGPVGATVTFTDLKGNPMSETLRTISANGTFNPGDLDGNGVEDYNSGIGQIRFSGTDSRTSFQMWGGTVFTATTAPDGFDGRDIPDVYWDGISYGFRLATSPTGLLDDFEQAGFGYIVDQRANQIDISGLPPGDASLIVGTPFIRPDSSIRPGTGLFIPDPNNPFAPLLYVTEGFNRTDQGIFVDGGASIGSVTIHGIVHGSSHFTGYVNKLSIGILMGSVTVDGDLGALIVGGDAGIWSPDPDFNTSFNFDRNNKTNGQVVVGRTAGQITIGGRSQIDVTVSADLANPQARPARDIYNYSELEAYSGLDTTATRASAVAQIMRNTANIYQDPTAILRTGQAPVVLGSTFSRNDSIMAAEFIGNAGTGVRVRGDLSARDPFMGEDRADVYAFPVDAGSIVNVQGTLGFNGSDFLYFRIVDQDGIVIAAPELPVREGNFIATQITWKAKQSGTYYLVVTDPNGSTENSAGAVSYSVTVTGMAPVTLGAFRTGGSYGLTDFASGEGSSINVLSGSVGSIRIGTAYLSNGAAETSPVEITNTTQNDDDAMSWQGGSIGISAGSLYNLTTGSDIGAPLNTPQVPINVIVSGDFGTLYTGMSPVPGGDRPSEGDVNYFNLSVGGRIGTLDIRGSVGVDRDEGGGGTDYLGVTAAQVRIRTGVSGGKGDIGMLRIGGHVVGDQLHITTSANSTIGAILISQDAYDSTDRRAGVYYGTGDIGLITGSGSDIRFLDVPHADTNGIADFVYPLIGGRLLELIDDGGARVQISVDNAPSGVVVGFVRALPVDGSQGVVIGQIGANLTGGRTLRITGVDTPGPGIVGIGHIVVLGDGASAVQVNGNVEVDVWRIEERDPGGQLAALGGGGGGGGTGNGFAFIENNSPNGDIVAIDVTAVTRVTIAGDLGRTQVNSWGPDLIGPYLGLAIGLQGDVGGALGVPGGVLLNSQLRAGKINRPIADDTNSGDGAQAALDDIGSPMDPYLNGLVVRAGNVDTVSVAGAIGDVILQSATGAIRQVTANSDNVTGSGRFDGIVGTIFARDMLNVNIGDGIAKPEPSPFNTVGVFAINNLVAIQSNRTTGVTIEGPISASNSVVDTTTTVAEGIDSISLSNATFLNSFIGVMQLDGFWESFNFGEDNVHRGDIGSITLTNNSKLFNTYIRTRELNAITMSAGVWDASRLDATANVANISVAQFRNSTLEGDLDELRPSRMNIGLDLSRLTVTGDIDDLILDISGRVRESIVAKNISRTTIDVDNELRQLTVNNDIRGSAITAGELPTVNAGRNITASTFLVSGVIGQFSASNAIVNSHVEVTGPDGRIDSVSSKTITGAIAASGPIGTVNASAGDLEVSVTTTGDRGNVGTLSAGRDLTLKADVSGNIGTLTAGRNFGRLDDPQVILVRGDLASASLPNGQLYNDIRVGGNVTGTVTIGTGIAKPGANLLGQGSIISFGRINSVIVNGDFDGSVISHSGGVGAVAINNGSFLPGNTIAAYDGSLSSVIITNGNLYGDIHADFDITLLRVAAPPAGGSGTGGSGGSGGGSAVPSKFGDVGINPARNVNTPVDGNRNELPPGVSQGTGYQGPMITAGKNIVKFEVLNGSVFEAGVYAERSITAITIAGSVSNDELSTGKGSFFAAGDSITSIAITGSVSNTAFVAGALSLGADGRVGGTGSNADSMIQGNIASISIGGAAINTSFSAGIAAGADGVYNTADDLSVFGLSTITALTIAGPVVNTSAFGDTLSPAVAGDARLIRGGTSLPNTNPDVDTGTGLPPSGTAFTGSRAFTVGGVTYTFVLTTGNGFFDAATGRLTLRNTTTSSNLTVSSSTGEINSIDIIGADDASLGVLTMLGRITGDSDIVIDGGVTTLAMGVVDGTGSIQIGSDVGAATFAALAGGSFSARSAATLTISGQFGALNPLTTDEARIDLIQAGTISISGVARGNINVEREATTLSLTGGSERALLRFGNAVGNISAGRISQTVISAGDSIGNVSVSGDFFDSALVSGVDMGSDDYYGGTGRAADVLSSGTIGNVTITGSFAESDITAGYLRGADGFFGTVDDTISAGRGSIGNVTINGNSVGSGRSTESYRIASNGSIGAVRIGGTTFVGSRGNFALVTPKLPPSSAHVTDIRLAVDGHVYTANIVFDQPIDLSTISSSLSVSEVRGSGDIEIRLIEGVDYSLVYSEPNRTIGVVFSRSVTDRSLPAVPGLPGPGVYRFAIDQRLFRAKLVGIGLDGNGNGFSEAGDNFSEDAVVGDAGDRKTPARVDANPGPGVLPVDLYGPANLDFVMDANSASDGLPDINKTYTVNGFIGDNPDNDSDYFRFSGDVDMYSITLQAGQILRLSSLQGNAARAGLSVFYSTAAGGLQLGVFNDNLLGTSLPVDAAAQGDLSIPSSYLIRQTGTYFIVVGNTANIFSTSTTTVTNPNITPNSIGDYTFSVQVFDDGDSGFNSTTDSGDGTYVVNAPPPSDFSGSDGVLGTADDLTSLIQNGYLFTRNADGSVSGTNGSGIVSTRSATGTLTNTINAAIGPAGHEGIPNASVTADVDVFHLNNRLPIAPGTKMRITVKLSDLGADLGSASPITFTDNRGVVQFALFDTSDSVTADDATLVFSPTDFLPHGGVPNTTIADNGETKYGYDANGDFFIEFVTPDRASAPGQAGTFAVYLQGAFNTDYALEVVTAGTGQNTKHTQNVFIETQGGSIDWLKPGGFASQIGGFNINTLGFTGTAANGQPLNTYVLQKLVSTLNSLFQGTGSGSGYDVRFSTNPADFEFQPYSTVFITSSTDPVLPLFNSFTGFNFTLLSQSFNSTQPYGFSEHSDPLNADLQDEAVVFVPSLAIKGIQPSLKGADILAEAISGAVARRVGELMGLRITEDNGNTTDAAGNPVTPTIFDPFAADAVDFQPNGDPTDPTARRYGILNTARTLSGSFDSITRTNFFLGRQNSASLLDKVLSRR